MRRTSLAVVFMLVLALSAPSVVVSESTTENVMEEAKDTANAAKEAAGDAVESVKEASKSVSEWLQQKLKDMGDKD